MLIKIVAFEELSFDQVEKGYTSLLSAFFMICSEDRDAIDKEGNNCIVVKRRERPNR